MTYTEYSKGEITSFATFTFAMGRSSEFTVKCLHGD